MFIIQRHQRLAEHTAHHPALMYTNGWESLQNCTSFHKLLDELLCVRSIHQWYKQTGKCDLFQRETALEVRNQKSRAVLFSVKERHISMKFRR